ncbi:hypothetical protein OROGR_030356 [Orobanche gracilis]
MAKSSKQKNNTPTTISAPSSTTATAETSDNNHHSSSISISIKKVKPKRESPQQRRSSIYRGVTRHRWTGRYEAHLWDKNSWNQSQSKKGKQVYLGAYNDEGAAARAYDLAALKYWGQDTILNFSLLTYQTELKEMEGQSKEEYIGSLRRKSSGFSRGVSKYRGVARHHHNGRWEARIGRVFGNKYLYLGTYATQEEAATAYDMAAVKYRGPNAVTNFDLSRYAMQLEPLPDASVNPRLIHVGNNIDNITMQEYPSQEIGLALLSENPALETTTLLPHLSGDKDPSSPFETKTEPNHPRGSFPDDIQTLFDFQDSSSFAEEHDVLFGNYDSFVSPVF